jgi:hypothetical protein
MNSKTSTKRKKTMARRNATEGIYVPQEEGIVFVEQRDTAAEANQQELGELLGKLTPQQQKLLANLRRLHHSLRGPEDVLDEDNYSRPFPPHIRIKSDSSDQ